MYPYDDYCYNDDNCYQPELVVVLSDCQIFACAADNVRCRTTRPYIAATSVLSNWFSTLPHTVVLDE